MDDVARLEDAVAEGRLRGVVDHVARRLDGGYRLTGAGGRVDWTEPDAPSVDGTDPVANQDPAHLATAADQREDPFPATEDNAFPYALENLTQFFDAAHAPDVLVIPHPGQRFDDDPGHHGGLGVVQARAPFVAAGRGVVARGWVDEHLRMIDVAPTLVALAGGAPLAVQDGAIRDELVAGEAEHVLVFLLDGTNAAALWSAVEDGAAPTIAGLIAEGTAYRHGVLAALPTATLANHTTALTGASPGHSGVMSHTWFDRSTGETPNLLDIPAMFASRSHVKPGVETVFEAIKRGRPGAVAVCTYEFCDRGADWSTFDLLERRARPLWPDDDVVAAQSAPELLADEATAFMAQVDTASTIQAVDRWSRREHDLPAFCWVSFTSTDSAGHAAGPHASLTRAAIADSDRRISRVLDAVDRAGALDRTAVVVLADHGMQQASAEAPVALDDHLPPDRWHLVDHQFAYANP